MHVSEPGGPNGDHRATESALEMRGVSITSSAGPSGRLLVNNVSLRVGPQETVGIVGESGSGKSLTALSALGLLPEGLRATGSIRFYGQELNQKARAPVRRLRGSGMSLLMQDPATMLNPLRRSVTHVEEGIAAHGERTSRKARRREALRRLSEVGIDADGALRYPFQVSGGMAQRVGLAAALAGDPRLLIADEPTTALDVTTQREILELLSRLRHHRAMSLVLITHDLQVAFEVCDRVYVMYAGSVVECAPARDLVKEPLHPYSHGLLLCEPTVGERRERLNTIPGSVPGAQEVVGRCAFADRCAWQQEICVAGSPPLLAKEADHQTACIRIDEIRDELRETFRVVADEQRSNAEQGRRDAGALLTVSNVVKSFSHGRHGATEVLHGVDLAVRSGESVGLVGESGSGKTTLARCVVGLEAVSGGVIELAGIDLSDYNRLLPADRSRARRSVQMVFQNPYASLNPARSIGSTLKEAAQMADPGERPDDRRIAELLEQVGLPASYARRRPSALSGGERQRVGIARALAVEPKLLVCDEPTSALDVSVQAQIVNLLRDLQRDLGLALLFITHDLAVVRQVSDYLYVIADGEFVEQGATAEVLDGPEHPYTQTLLASAVSATP